MQTAVAAAEEQQGVQAGIEARLNHLPDQDVVVAPVIDREVLAFDGDFAAAGFAEARMGA